MILRASWFECADQHSIFRLAILVSLARRCGMQCFPAAKKCACSLDITRPRRSIFGASET